MGVNIYIIKNVNNFFNIQKKTNLEKIFNYTIALIFSFLEFMSYYVISRIEQNMALVGYSIWMCMDSIDRI